MRALVIGTGAAGNKAVIRLVENNIIPKEDIKLFNTTIKDIPEGYKDCTILIKGSDLDGCGQEREFGRELMCKALERKEIDLKSLYDPSVHKMVIVVSSTEGGTGAGSAPVIARYYSKVVKVPTHLIGFVGFGKFGRNLSNTVSYSKDITEGLVVQLIENGKFLDECKGNELLAEKAANEELCARVAIMTGKVIMAGEQNIDNNDLFKLINTPGYEEIAYRVVDTKIKTKDQFNSIIKSMISDSKSVDLSTASQLRMGGIYNIPKNEQENIDLGLSEVVDKYGVPFECFKHVQSVSEFPSFIAFISSGNKLPLEEIEEINQKSLESIQSVSMDSDKFYSSMKNMETSSSIGMFNCNTVSDSEKDVSSEEDDEKDFFASWN